MTSRERNEAYLERKRASAAECKRRSRAHLRGDHTICLPKTCPDAGPGDKYNARPKIDAEVEYEERVVSRDWPQRMDKLAPSIVERPDVRHGVARCHHCGHHLVDGPVGHASKFPFWWGDEHWCIRGTISKVQWVGVS